MGCNVSKYTLNDELDVKECNLSISSSYCKNNNNNNNNNNNDCGIINNNYYHKYIDELEQTIVHYITHNNKKTKLSIDDEKKVMEKIKKILKELRDISKLEESKIDSTMITYDKKILVLLNLFRKNFTSLYYKMEDDINKTILLLNEREIFTDMTDDELSPEASLHYETNAESEDHNDDIPPPPPPKTPRFTKSYKKAQLVDQSKKTINEGPITFYKLTGDISSVDTRTARTTSTDSTDYGFIDLSLHGY